jgi:hypothetical protein
MLPTGKASETGWEGRGPITAWRLLEPVGLVAHEGDEGRLDFAAGAGVEDLSLQSDGARRE